MSGSSVRSPSAKERRRDRGQIIAERCRRARSLRQGSLAPRHPRREPERTYQNLLTPAAPFIDVIEGLRPAKAHENPLRVKIGLARSGEIAGALETSRPYRCLIRSVRVARIIGH